MRKTTLQRAGKSSTALRWAFCKAGSTDLSCLHREHRRNFKLIRTDTTKELIFETQQNFNYKTLNLVFKIFGRASESETRSQWKEKKPKILNTFEILILRLWQKQVQIN